MEGNTPNRRSRESAEKMRLAVEKLEREVFKPEPLPERTLPWLIDIFLYPMSISGVIHMVIFAIIPPLLWLLVLRYIRPFGGVPYLILYLLLAGYAFYYISYCVFDSSRGGLRAPDVTIYDSPDKIGLFSQVFLVIGVVAVCFFPAVIYYIVTERADLVFLAAVGGLYFLSPDGYVDSSIVRFGRCAQTGYDYHLDIQNVCSVLRACFNLFRDCRAYRSCHIGVAKGGGFNCWPYLPPITYGLSFGHSLCAV